jgi:excisionase family DNA binding protein
MSVAWIRKRTQDSSLPHYRVGRRALYSREDLQAYMDARRVDGDAA